MASVFVLESDELRLEFDPRGRLVALRDKHASWDILDGPELSRTVWLRVPVGAHRNNVADCGLLAPEIAQTGQSSIGFHWKFVEGNRSGMLDIGVRLRVRLEGHSVRFDVDIENASSHVIEEVWTPWLGGIRPAPGLSSLRSHAMHLCGGWTRSPLADGFPAEIGYWGTDSPAFLRTFPGPGLLVPFILLANEMNGLYVGVHDEELNIAHFMHELLPGFLDAKHGRVPRERSLGGHPAGFRVGVARMPFIQPGESRRLAPVVLQPYTGTWHSGLGIYKDWRDEWFRRRPVPGWFREIDAWQTVHLDSPEGCTRLRYADLPSIAREAKAQGVGALQVIGWAWEGQDGGEPFQDANPRLGTPGELKSAIAECQVMGVRILLMGKFKWADRTTDRYREELEPLVVRDMHGQPVHFDGYGYQTLSQLTHGGSRRTGAGLCHLSGEFRALARREFAKVLDLGASGFLYDELANHMILCFDRTHGHRPGECTFKGSLELAREFHGQASAKNPEFVLAGEGPNDALTQFYSANYIRTWDGFCNGEPEHLPAMKVLDPEMTIAAAVTGFDDRETINLCLAFGYAAVYEPFHFKGRLSDMPATVAYGRQVQSLRARLREFLWDGIFHHTVGVEFEQTVSPRRALIGRFTTRNESATAVVVVNQEPENSLDGRVAVRNLAGPFELHRPESGQIESTDGRVVVPPRSAAVLVSRSRT